MPPSGPYGGKTVALATRHGKERVIGRALRWGLGAELLHVQTIDTDALGTFCGMVQRQGSALEACIAKAEAALEAAGTPLAIASEGSFGPHPHVPFLVAGVECLVFLDRQRGLTIGEQALARRTNFSHRRVVAATAEGTDGAFQGWLAEVGFPSHALMVRPSSGGSSPGDGGGANPLVDKGLRDLPHLQDAIRRAATASADGEALVETDMRAHCNPTRMAAIRRLAFRLVRRIATPCPSCATPGWGVVEQRSGLLCGECGLPTDLAKAEVWGCQCCPHQEEKPRADGLLRADPGQCAWCNP